MIGFIIVCLLSVNHINGREFVVLRTLGTSVTASSEPVEGILNQSYSTLSGHWPVTLYVKPPETFQSQDTSYDLNQPQITNRNLDRKLPRLFLSHLILAAMNQHPIHSKNGLMNVKNSSNPNTKLIDDDRIVFKNEEVNRVETNTVVPINDTSETYSEETTAQTTEYAKSNKTTVSETDSNSTSVDVSLEDRASFVGDSCPTGYAKVNGKCVPIVE